MRAISSFRTEAIFGNLVILSVIRNSFGSSRRDVGTNNPAHSRLRVSSPDPPSTRGRRRIDRHHRGVKPYSRMPGSLVACNRRASGQPRRRMPLRVAEARIRTAMDAGSHGRGQCRYGMASPAWYASGIRTARRNGDAGAGSKPVSARGPRRHGAPSQRKIFLGPHPTHKCTR